MHDPRVPETLEGWSVLHQMFRIRWPEWRVRPADRAPRLAAEAAEALAAMRRGEAGHHACRSTLLGHKGDLMLIHFRRSFEELQAAQLAVARLGLSTFLEPTTSFVSVVELGMYEMTAQIHRRLGERGLEDGLATSSRAAFDAEMEEQRKRVAGRLFVEVPRAAPRLLLPDEQAPRRAQELVRRAGRGPRAHDARPRQDRPPLRGRRSPRSSPARSASTTGSGASTSSPTTPSSSRSSSTRCASTRPRPGTRSSGRSTSACSSRRPSCRSTSRARVPARFRPAPWAIGSRRRVPCRHTRHGSARPR